MDDPSPEEIWNFPENGKLPPVDWIWEAGDLTEAIKSATSFQKTELAAMKKNKKILPASMHPMLYKHHADMSPFSIQLAETHPTGDLPHEYDVMFAETQRLRDEISSQITAKRQVKPTKVSLPEYVFEVDDWSDDLTALFEYSDVLQYWPPQDNAPAIGLIETQEDGGWPIEIRLLLQELKDHESMMGLLGKFGGRLD